jgi:hypothetical protein
VEPTCYAEQAPLLPGESPGVNPFDWSQEFGKAMRAGGFDAVIGNPPWLMAGYYVKDSLEYFRER